MEPDLSSGPLSFPVPGSPGRLAACLWAAAFYVILFPLAHARLGHAATAICLLPVLTAALLLGTRGGLAAGLIAVPVNLLLLWPHVPAPVFFLGESFLFSQAVFLTLGGTVGRLATLRSRLQKERSAGRQAEKELRNHRSHLEDLITARTVELEMVNHQLQQEIEEREKIEEEIRKLNEGLEKIVRERTAELRNAFEELKEIDNMKDSFLSVVSHELRTPLTSIQSFSEILLIYDNEDRATQREFLEIINSESRRLTRLINNLLDISKIEARKMVYHDESVCLGELIREVARTLHRQIEERSLALRLELDPALPAVFADPDRIHQVVTNLLSNAVKFSHKGGEIRVRASAFREESGRGDPQWVRVSVSDQGIGLDEKDHEIIFEKFHQVMPDTLKDRPKGTGLGLPICREIVSHYGGRISVEGQKGKGCTFVFTLPCKAREAAVAGPEEAPHGKT